jgi:hypothetical protein
MLKAATMRICPKAAPPAPGADSCATNSDIAVPSGRP